MGTPSDEFEEHVLPQNLIAGNVSALRSHWETQAACKNLPVRISTLDEFRKRMDKNGNFLYFVTVFSFFRFWLNDVSGYVIDPGAGLIERLATKHDFKRNNEV